MKGNERVFVFSMSKSGGGNVWQSLQRYGLKEARHFHSMRDDSRRDWKYISLVRELFGRNLSHFFSLLSRRKNIHPNQLTFEQLKEFFTLYQGQGIDEHWIPRNLIPRTKIDVYQYPFPKEQGYLEINNLLILKMNLKDEVKAKAIQSFLGLGDDFKILRGVNEACSRNYFQQYQTFKKKVRFSEKYLEQFLMTKYMHHFFTKEEHSEVRRAWSENYETSFVS